MNDFNRAAAVPLRQKNLDQLPDDIQTPSYDREQVKTGVLHIGPSNFFRGHQAVYYDDLLEKGHMDYGVAVVSLRASDRTAQLLMDLDAQDHLYTVIERDADGVKKRVIGSIQESINAVSDPEVAAAKFTDPDINMVTLTVTQNGYYNDKTTGTIDLNHPEIIRCMKADDDFQTTIGYIAKGLKARYDAGMEPVTIMSCDNLPGNGTVLKNVVLGYLKFADETYGFDQDFYDWVKDSVPFPETMVDRIVPAPEKDDIQALKQDSKLSDAAPIFTESFRQWVIENKGVTGSLTALKGPTNVANDVASFELTKIRMLNGSHLALGLVGRQMRYETSDEAMKNPDIKAYISRYMGRMTETRMIKHTQDYENTAERGTDDLTEKLEERDKKSAYTQMQRSNLSAYKNQTMSRLANPHMGDELYRIARNGSQKVPSRFLDTARELSAHDEGYEEIAFGLASWMHYLTLKTDEGRDTDINDSEAIRLGLPGLMMNNSAISAEQAVEKLFEVEEIFAKDIREHEELKAKTAIYYDHIEKHGMDAALAAFLEGDIDTSLRHDQSNDRKQHPRP